MKESARHLQSPSPQRLQHSSSQRVSPLIRILAFVALLICLVEAGIAVVHFANAEDFSDVSKLLEQTVHPKPVGLSPLEVQQLFTLKRYIDQLQADFLETKEKQTALGAALDAMSAKQDDQQHGSLLVSHFRPVPKSKFTPPPLADLHPGTRQIPSFIAIRHRFSRSEADTSPCLCNGVASSNCSSAAHEAFCAEMDNAMQASSAIDSEALSPYFSAPRDVVDLSDELFLGPGANVRAQGIRSMEIDVVITYVNGSVPEWQALARAEFKKWFAQVAEKDKKQKVKHISSRDQIRKIVSRAQKTETPEETSTHAHMNTTTRRLLAYQRIGHRVRGNNYVPVRHNIVLQQGTHHESVQPAKEEAHEAQLPTTPRPASQTKSSLDLARFRDWNELLYALRSIFFHGMCQPRGGRRSDNDTDLREAFVDLEDGDGGCPRGTEPWILRNVYVVVPSRSHIPFWLDASHKRIRIVTDEDLKKGESDQPTFNSNVIESLLHRIPGLSRFFLYFNNDMMLGRRVSLFDYFRPVAPSRVKGIKLPHDPTSYMLMEPILYVDQRGMCGDKINTKYFRRSCWEKKDWSSSAVLGRKLNHNRKIVFERFHLIPSHSHPAHLPFLIDRTILEEMMDVTLKDIVPRDHAFREDTDLWMAYLYPYYALLKREQFHAVSKETPLVTLPRDASAGNGKLAEEFIYVPWRPSVLTFPKVPSRNSSESFLLSFEHFATSADNWIAEKTAEAFFLLDRKSIYGFTMLEKMEHVVWARRNLVAFQPLFITLNDDWPAESSTETIHLFTAAAGLIPQGEASHGKRPKRYILRSFAEIENRAVVNGTIIQPHVSHNFISVQKLMREITSGCGPAPWEL